MKVTVKSLAQAAGVSRGTVDRVLHNRGGVKPEVVLKIKNLAKELGYIPNRAGKALAAYKTPIKIGVMLPSIGNPFFDGVIEGVFQARDEFADLGVEVVLKEIEGFDSNTHLKAIDELLAKGCKALCLSTLNIEPVREKISDLNFHHLPVVLLNTNVENVHCLCYVGSDYLAAGATCGGMLAMCAKDPLKILIVTGSKMILGHNQRIDGFKQELDRQHAEYRIVDIVECNDSDIKATRVTLDALDEYEDVNCIYIAGAGIQGVGAAILARPQRKIFAIAFDEVYSTKELVKQGIIKFIVCQQPERQGYHAIKRAYLALTHQIPEQVDDFITETIIKIQANL